MLSVPSCTAPGSTSLSGVTVGNPVAASDCSAAAFTTVSLSQSVVPRGWAASLCTAITVRVQGEEYPWENSWTLARAGSGEVLGSASGTSVR